LTLDGMTGASQDRMRGTYQTQAHSMMYSVNKFSIIMLGASECSVLIHDMLRNTHYVIFGIRN